MLTTLDLEIPDTFADRLRDTHKDGLEAAVVAGLKFWLAVDADTRQLLSAVAAAEGISKGEAMAKAVKHYYEHSQQVALMPTEVVPRLNRAQRKERNDRIAELAARGMTKSAIAAEVGLSTIRVFQILAEIRAREDLTQE